VRGVAIEACNGAASLAQEMVGQLGWSVSLAHPGYVHRIKRSPDKSDFSDSRLLGGSDAGGLPCARVAGFPVHS
jgi:hypothetical protein